MDHTEKAIVLIIDGAAGWPVDELDGCTTLEAAATPHLDRLAQEGVVGLTRTVPEGMEPSSAVACMSVLGFDPSLYYTGRGPIEALALGIELEPGQAALRCNLVSVQEGRLRSYTSGHIPSCESHELIAHLQRHLGSPRVSFHAGVGFRHIVTVKDGAALLEAECTPPHDIPEQLVADHLPKGSGSEILLDLMERSQGLLAEHPVNRARVQRGELPTTQIWLFWPGMQPGAMPSFASTYNCRAALSTAVDLLRGLARQVSMDILDIPGVTDTNDNDFAGQMAGSLEALRDYDAVIVHVEAPDEAGHAGRTREKVEALEMVDRLMVPQILDLPYPVRLLVQPDHPTPLRVRTHVSEPVPFLVWAPGKVVPNGADAYSEAQAAGTGLLVDPGYELMRRFLAVPRPKPECS
ncbi:MAG: cofactor-independent phosphoglycerate mutase [Actinobacteria bacterium]|nr:cofactor-independent phosphoglycerate mutase [Actinomycetota bacterium]